MEALLVMTMVAVAGMVIAWPLVADRAPRTGPDAERLALEAERDAKLAEIRDAELDLRGGKLAAEDHAGVDARLRGEVAAILRRLDEVGGS